MNRKQPYVFYTLNRIDRSVMKKVANQYGVVFSITIVWNYDKCGIIGDISIKIQKCGN